MAGSNQQQRIIDLITPVFRTVFENEKLIVNRDLQAQMVENWDSLNHIALIVELEQTTGVQFTTDELAAMVNTGDLIDCLAKKGVCA